MKAAVMTRFREPLEVQNLPDPSPVPDGALINVKGSGICGSDWHLWQQDWTWAGLEIKLPHVMGHEFCGIVEEVGSKVTKFKRGDRVTVPFHIACGHCEYCYTGRSNLCMKHGIIGAHFFGGYGNLTVVPAADVNLVPLPDEVDFVSAASLGCRFMTSYHGIMDIAKVRPGEWVAVFGMGGVGLSAVQIAAAAGARVIAISNTESKLKKAKHEGAEETLKASDVRVSEAIKDLTDGGADVAVDAFGSGKTILQSIQALKKGGRHIQLGLTGKEDKGIINIPVDVMMFQEVSFLCSLGCPTTSYKGMLAMVADKKLNPKRIVSREISIEDASNVLASMTDFKTQGFNVINRW